MIFLNWLPLSSKSINWSNEEHPGDKRIVDLNLLFFNSEKISFTAFSKFTDIFESIKLFNCLYIKSFYLVSHKTKASLSFSMN